jgi:hypothetical protein
MRKVIAVFSVIMIVLLAASFGCGGKEETKKTVTSRPVTVKSDAPVASAPEPVSAAPEQEATTTIAEEETAEAPSFSSGGSDCEVLGSDDISVVFAGTWEKTSDCPQKPAMPKGVSVCICSYDGPKQLYVNVETQKYTDAAEALRVYNMYCKGTKEENEVGEKSCRQLKSSANAPSFVYFLKGSEFVKVSCLGGTCPLDGIASIAKAVEAKI